MRVLLFYLFITIEDLCGHFVLYFLLKVDYEVSLNVCQIPEITLFSSYANTLKPPHQWQKITIADSKT